jgi:hypothetical protein
MSKSCEEEIKQVVLYKQLSQFRTYNVGCNTVPHQKLLPQEINQPTKPGRNEEDFFHAEG